MKKFTAKLSRTDEPRGLINFDYKGLDHHIHTTWRAPAMTTSVPSFFFFPFPLPLPNLYEEIHCEALTCLKLEVFEGIRMDLTKFFTKNFCISHRFQNQQLNLGATTINYTDSKLMLLGKMAVDGRLNAKFKYDFTRNLALTANVHLTDEPHGLINFGYKRSEFHVQCHMGSGGLLGATYMMQNFIHPRLSFGWEVIRPTHYTKFDCAFVAHYDDGKTIATGHFRDVIALSYVHKVNEKVCLASNFFYDCIFKDIRASFGCCLNNPNSRGDIGHGHRNVVMTQIKGKIDSNGVVAVLVQHGGGIVSFQFDLGKLDYKIGIGFKISDRPCFLAKTSEEYICG